MAAAELACFPTLANRYTFDDVHIVERDRLIRTLGGIPALFHQDGWAPFGRMGLYRPLVKATFAVGWVAAPLRGLEISSQTEPQAPLRSARGY